MIIDIHAHVSAPPELYAFQANLLASRGAQRRSRLKLDDEKIEKALERHLKFLEEAGTDTQLLSPRPYTLMHHEKPDKIVHWYIEACNDLIARQCKMHPDTFKGVAALPQAVGVDIKQALPELERCVKELGFVGCLVNPDPGARGDDTTPGMGDEYWYPLYEKLVELDVPCMIHSSTCMSSRLSYTLHFINEESIAIISLLNSRVLDDFPKLKIIVAHGGGAIPYQIGRFMAGRYASRRNLDRKPVPESKYFENAVKKLHYDTCLYTAESLELLFKVMGADNCLFGTESPGAGSSVEPRTGRAMDDIKPVIESFDWLTDADRKKIFESNARKLFEI
ncbi:MAG: amidohydrolase family protein [Proteobacteria bacterium]|nr:amidohydrolase family protein [Pseudomonadota bacterium]